VLPVIVQAPQSIPELQGSDVTFSCSATGIPLPTILWTFTNGDSQTSTLASTRHYQSNGSIIAELYLINVTADNFGTYSCVALNIFAVDSYSVTLVLQSSKLSELCVFALFVRQTVLLIIQLPQENKFQMFEKSIVRLEPACSHPILAQMFTRICQANGPITLNSKSASLLAKSS